MAVPSWPATVPSAMLRDDFQVAQSNTPPLKSEMQAGNVRMRPQFTVRVTTLRVAILMTDSELANFETFIFTTLGQGSSKFTMPIYKGNTDVTKTCYLQDGTANWQRSGLHWKVTFNLCVENY